MQRAKVGVLDMFFTPIQPKGSTDRNREKKKTKAVRILVPKQVEGQYFLFTGESTSNVA